MPQLEEVDYNLDRWLQKWRFILHNDSELSSAAAGIALKQLNDIVSYEVERARGNPDQDRFIR